MNKILLLIAMAVVASFFYKRAENEEKLKRLAMAREMTSTPEDSCKGKAYCVFVYMAPWCPYCRAEIPEMKKFADKVKSHPQIGLKIAIGRGDFAKSVAMATEIGDSAHADKDDHLSSLYKIQKFPSIFVLDAEAAPILRDQEALDWAREHVN